MKELRVPSDQIRIFFAFDPLRRAILLTGGSKLGNPAFYRTMVDRADRLYDAHLSEL